MQYGYPEQSRRPIYTVTVDLPREVEEVTDPTGTQPPIQAHGPLDKNQSPEDVPPRFPDDVEIEGTICEFTFNPPLEEGRHEIVVYQSRFEAKDGTPFELVDEEGPFTGWTVQVLNAQNRYTPDAAQPEEETVSRVSAEVLIDGETANGTGISGEVLTVITSDPANVTLEIESLIPSKPTTLYEEYLSRTEHKVDGTPAVSFTSAGPITNPETAENFSWAVYNGTSTIERIPLDRKGEAVTGVPVMREPTEARYDPLIKGTPKTKANERQGPSELQSYPVDDLPGKGVAWAFEALTENYDGPVIEARRGNGKTRPVETRDFTAQEIIDGDLAAWAEPTGRVFLRKLYDQNGNSRSATDSFSLSTTPNDVPTVYTDGLEPSEGQRVFITKSSLWATDDVVQPVSLNFTVEKLPSHGLLELGTTALGKGDTFTAEDIKHHNLQYKHDGTENHTDSLKFTVDDSRGSTTTVRELSIDITPVNDPPAASDDSYTTEVNTTLSVAAAGVLGNDTDVEGNPLTTTGVVSGPHHGSVSLESDGSFDYTPDVDFNGTDDFTYEVTDGENTSTATVSISVVGGPKVTTNVGGSVDENSSTTITQSDLETTDPNDVAADLIYTLDAVPDDGDLLLSGTALSIDDTFTQKDINDGNLSYTHDGTQELADSFSFTAEDTDGYKTTGQFVLKVKLANDAPTAFDNSYTVEEDTALEPSAPGLLGNASDPNRVDTLKVNTTPVQAPNDGTLTLYEDGSFKYLPDPDFNGTDQFVYEVTDGRGGTAQATASIEITKVNDQPTVTRNIGLVMQPGEEKTVDQNLLQVTDVENAPHQIIYVIEEMSYSGRLYKNEIKLTEGDVFTQKDINNGEITYKNAAEMSNDQFTFRVIDQGGRRNARQTVLDLQPEIENPGTMPSINPVGDEHLKVSFVSPIDKYSVLAIGGNENGETGSLFTIGSTTEWETYSIDKSGTWFHQVVGFYDEETKYSSAEENGRRAHIIRRKDDTLEAELAVDKEFIEHVGQPDTDRTELRLGQDPSLDYNESISIEKFVLWRRRISDKEKDTQIKAPRNVYTEYSPLIVPQNRSARIEQYNTTSTLWPKHIYDPNNTPANNPRLFEDSLYRAVDTGEGWTPLQEDYAVFDFPLHSKLTVSVNGREVWSGQTRLMPVLVDPRKLETELGWNIPNDEVRQEALERIWKASMEALRLWGCPIPHSGRPTSSMKEFVLTYLANPTNRQDGTQDVVTTKLGDEMVQAKNDRASERRLANLAELLRDCEQHVPVDVNAMTHARSVGIGKNAYPEYYPDHNAREIMSVVAPTYDMWARFDRKPSVSEHHRIGLT